MTDGEILDVAHRMAWRYKHSSDPHHNDTYTFNRSTLLKFARKLAIDEREQCAKIADDMDYSPDGAIGKCIRMRSDVEVKRRFTASAATEDWKMMEWQPIETAPKDGTAVLVYPPTWSGRTAAVAQWNEDMYSKKPQPYWDRDDDLGRTTVSRNKPPTHWMPMPAPPSNAKVTGSPALSASPRGLTG